MTGQGRSIALMAPDVVRVHSMQRIVTRETLSHQTRHCTDNSFQPLGDLILDDAVKQRVYPDVREFLALSVVGDYRELYAFLFVKREPIACDGRYFRVVLLHVCLN
jgi:hypothetical protein